MMQEKTHDGVKFYPPGPAFLNYPFSSITSVSCSRTTSTRILDRRRTPLEVHQVQSIVYLGSGHATTTWYLGRSSTFTEPCCSVC